MAGSVGGLGHAERRQDLGGPVQGGDVGGVQLDQSAPARDLSSSGVPWAMTRPPSMITMRGGQVVGLVEVLGRQQDVGPGLAMSRMASHTSMRLPGSRPVVGSSSRSSRGAPTRLAPRSSRRRMPPE